MLSRRRAELALSEMQTIALAGCGRDGCPAGKYGNKLCERCQLAMLRIATSAIADAIPPTDKDTR